MTIYPTLVALTVLALAGAGIGIWLAAVPALSRRIVPFSGGLLAGIALFWILPEIAELAGWLVSAVALVSSFAPLWSLDRYSHPLCPTLSHTHPHEECHQSMHGSAARLPLHAEIHR